MTHLASLFSPLGLAQPVTFTLRQYTPMIVVIRAARPSPRKLRALTLLEVMNGSTAVFLSGQGDSERVNAFETGFVRILSSDRGL